MLVLTVMNGCAVHGYGILVGGGGLGLCCLVIVVLIVFLCVCIQMG